MTAEIIPHDFGKRIAPEDVPGEFPACLRVSHTLGPCEHDRGPFELLEAEGVARCACGEKKQGQPNHNGPDLRGIVGGDVFMAGATRKRG